MAKQVDLRKTVFVVEEVFMDALSIVYPAGHDEESVYPYNLMVLANRHDEKFLWAQSDPAKPDPNNLFDAKGNLNVKIPFGGLQPGDFIKCRWREREKLPGASQEWRIEEPDGEHIYYVLWQHAPKAERFPSTVVPAKRSRRQGNNSRERDISRSMCEWLRSLEPGDSN